MNRTREAGGAAPSSASPATPAALSAPADRVVICAAGHALAAQGADGAPGEPMIPERLARLRRQVLGGAYDSLAVVDQIARRMLQSGDV